MFKVFRNNHIPSWLTVAVFLIGGQATAAPQIIYPDSGAEVEPIAWRSFKQAQGMDGGSVRDLAEDDQGRIWAATNLGVYGYDGRRWEAVANTAELIPVRLLATADRLWIGGEEGLMVLKGEQLISLQLPPPIGLGQTDRGIQALSAAKDGDAWVGVDGALYRCNLSACAEQLLARGIRVAVIAQQQQRLWLGTAFEGLYWIDDIDGNPHLTTAPLTKTDGLPNSAIRSLDAAPEDLWIGTGRGLFHRNQDGEQIFSLPEQYPLIAAIAHLESENPGPEKRWLALKEHGLGSVEGDRWRRYGVQQGLPPDSVGALLVDHLGQLWLGTDSNGILRMDPDLIAVYDERSGLPQRAITGVGRARFPDSNSEQLWVATKGGLARWVQGRWQAAPAPLDQSVVQALVSTADGIWLADQKGLLHWTAAGITRLDASAAGLNVGTIDHLLVDPLDGALWVGWGHGLARYDGRSAAAVEIEKIDSGGIAVKRMLALNDGQWLLLHTGGIAWFKAGEVMRQVNPCPKVDRLYDIVAVPNGYLLAGMRGLYITDHQGAGCEPLGDFAVGRYGPPALISGAPGYLYILDGSGLRLLRENDLLHPIAHWTKADGLPTTSLSGLSYFDPKGRLWLPTIDGLAVVPPNSGPPGHAPSELRLLSALAGDRAFGDGEVLSDQRSNIHFEFLLPDLVREQRIRYCSQLSGPLPQARRCDDQTAVTYSRLPAGNYHFHVEAYDGFERPAGSINIDFVLLPPWWMRGWALALATLSLLMLGAAVGWLRNRSLRQLAQNLSLRVEERTRELALANQQLQQAAWMDPLTSAGNRRACYEQTLPQLHRQGTLHAILLIDADHFKLVNDRYGHEIGDQVLVTLAERVRQTAGPSARLFRWGGEEFLLIAPVTDAAKAASLANAVRLAVGGVAMPVPTPEPLLVTCSIGWVCVEAGPMLTEQALEAALSQADQAVYAAKAAGRNRAMAAPPSR